jgi:hypothetical protein
MPASRTRRCGRRTPPEPGPLLLDDRLLYLDGGIRLQSATVPLRLHIECPTCSAPLVRKPGGRCPSCGTNVAQHVVATRNREERIEKVVAIVGTVLVLALFTLTAGLGLLEGVAMYAAAGAIMFYLARRTF